MCESKGCEQWERARRRARRRPDTWQGKFVANNSVLAQSTYFTPNLGGWEMVVLRVPATHTPSLLTVSLSLSHTTHTMCAAHTMRPSFEEEAVVFNLRAASHPRGMAPPGKGRFLLPLRGLGDWPLSSQLPAAQGGGQNRRRISHLCCGTECGSVGRKAVASSQRSCALSCNVPRNHPHAPPHFPSHFLLSLRTENVMKESWPQRCPWAPLSRTREEFWQNFRGGSELLKGSGSADHKQLSDCAL